MKNLNRLFEEVLIEANFKAKRGKDGFRTEDDPLYDEMREYADDLVYKDPPDEDWDGDNSYIAGLLRDEYPGFSDETYENVADYTNQYYWDMQYGDPDD